MKKTNWIQLSVILSLWMVIIIIMIAINRLYDRVEIYHNNTPKTSLEAIRDTISVNLTVNTSTAKEHSWCYPVTYSGLDIDIAKTHRCCAISNDILTKYNLKMLRYVYIKCTYPFLSGYYLIIDKGPRNNNTVEIIYEKSSQFKMKFYLKNQSIIY